MRLRSRLAVLCVGAALVAIAGGSPVSAGGVGTPVVAIPGSFIAGWATPAASVQVGGILPMVSADLQPHNICIRDGATTHCGVEQVAAGVTLDTPTGFLVAGNTYPFFCGVHPSMTGTLLALPGV